MDEQVLNLMNKVRNVAAAFDTGAVLPVVGTRATDISRAITLREQDFANVWNQKDPAAIRDFYSRDAVVHVLDGPKLDGREAIMGAVAQLIKEYDLTLMSAEVQPISNRIVSLYSTWERDMGGGKTTMVASQALLIKGKDQKWRLKSDMLSEMSAAPAAK
jgi:ketosteroid isomerase-like protein